MESLGLNSIGVGPTPGGGFPPGRTVTLGVPIGGTLGALWAPGGWTGRVGWAGLGGTLTLGAPPGRAWALGAHRSSRTQALQSLSPYVCLTPKQHSPPLTGLAGQLPQVGGRSPLMHWKTRFSYIVLFLLGVSEYGVYKAYAGFLADISWLVATPKALG